MNKLYIRHKLRFQNTLSLSDSNSVLILYSQCQQQLNPVGLNLIQYKIKEIISENEIFCDNHGYNHDVHS